MLELKHAVRNLWKSPTLTAISVLSLALGIGLNVTVFSVVREMILDDVSARHPQQLARIEGTSGSYALYQEIRATGPFEDVAFHHGLSDAVWHADGRNEIAWTLATSATFFDVLGVRASAGRLYTRADKGRDLAVVSHAFWRRRLHANPYALRQSIQLNGKLYTVAGVLPPDYRSVFGHGVSPEIYLSEPPIANPQDRVGTLFGRLRPGDSRDQAIQALRSILDRLPVRRSPKLDVRLRPMSGAAAMAGKGDDERRFLLFFAMLFAVAAILTLIACGNVAGLLIARALNRRRDMAIRQALGASRLQLARPLLSEGLVLVVAGTASGLTLDAALRNALSTLRWPSAYGLPIEFHLQSDSSLLLYASLIASAVLLLTSLLPALGKSDVDLSRGMKQAEPPLSIRRWDLRNSFVTLQVVLTVILLALTGLFGRGLLRLWATGPGFDASHTLIAGIHTIPRQFATESLWTLRQTALARLRATPGVVSVTSAGILPLMGEMPDTWLRTREGTLSQPHHAYVSGVGEHYCATLSIPILRGRDFDIGDRERTPVPVILNRTLAHTLLSDGNPIGRTLWMGRENPERVQVVGVAADARIRTLGEGAIPALFRPDFNAQFIVRVAGPPTQWIEPLRRTLAAAQPSTALDVRPLKDAVDGAMFPMRVAVGFVGGLSLLGFLLALIGLYGTVSYAVSRRTREFGIRTALGASRASIVRTALRDATTMLTTGAVLGLPLALAAFQPLADLLPAGLDPWAPTPNLATVLLLLVTGVAAALIPARRAAHVDPAKALRAE